MDARAPARLGSEVAARMADRAGRPRIAAAADALVWSSLWLALAVAALAVAAARAMETEPAGEIVGLVFSGTVVVYVLDRLRDLSRDRQTEPLRSAFVGAHRTGLQILTGVCAVGSIVLGVRAGPAVILLAAGVLTVGLLHRRLKRWTLAKPLYVALACTAVTVGFTWVHAPIVRHGAWVAGIVAATAASNVLLYNLRDERDLTLWLGGRRGTRLVSGACLVLALALAVLGPTPVQPLAWLPIAMAACLLVRRPSERFAAWAVDGALLLGALLAALTPVP